MDNYQIDDLSDYASEPLEQPEIAFWRYCLLQAIKQAQFGDCMEMYWLFSDKRHVGSFRFVCAAIGYDKRRVRRGIIDKWDELQSDFFGMSLNGGRARWARERRGERRRRGE